jgi:hypothetical protein
MFKRQNSLLTIFIKAVAAMNDKTVIFVSIVKKGSEKAP